MMGSEQIQEVLHRRDLSFGVIAEALGVSVAHVSQVAARKSTSHRVAVAIATALERPVAEVFSDKPEYHGPYRPKADRRAQVRALRHRLQAA